MKKILAVLFVLYWPALPAQDLSTVVETYLKAVGGKEAVEKIVSAKTTNLWINYPNDTTIMVSVTKVPHFMHLQSYSENPKVLTGETYTNQDGWIFCFVKPFPARHYTSARAKQSVCDARMILEAYKDKKLKFKGADKIGNIECYVIEKKDLNQQQKLSAFNYYFDKTTGLLQASAPAAAVAKGTYTIYSDYRKVDGILFPFKSESYLINEHRSSMQYLEVQFNVPVDDAAFKPTEAIGEPKRDKNSEYNKVEYVKTELSEATLEEVIQNFKGKRMMIDLWATWCGPCKYEFMKYDTALYSFLNSFDIEVVFISIDEQNREDDWIADLRWFNLNGYHLRAEKKLIESIRKTIYKNEPLQIPRCILVDEQGKIVSDDIGRPSGDQFKEIIKRSFPR
jgi:thiol-disulfide isomerase/thioredoxin